MKELGLQKEISDYAELFDAFEGLLKVRDKFYVTDDHLATALCELYATKGSYQILACMSSINEFEVTPIEENENRVGACESLPKHEAVQKAGRGLLAAFALHDKGAALDALREMGVLGRCPSPECIFARMELVTERVTGHAQQVFLVELSRFAAKIGDYESASKYVWQARAFDPSSWELYNIGIIEGLIALNAGRVDQAVQCLARSIHACLAYEKARAQCCVRAPSLELAEKLLERGEGEAVLRHLSECRNVWAILQPQIDSWIHIVDDGGRPDFQATGNLRVPESPSHTLRMQWMNACSLAKGPVSADVKATPPKSPAERRAERERWMAEHEHLIDSLITRKIAYLEKDFVTPPDWPSTNPSGPGPA
jgi:hypothetical protein